MSGEAQSAGSSSTHPQTTVTQKKTTSSSHLPTVIAITTTTVTATAIGIEIETPLTGAQSSQQGHITTTTVPSPSLDVTPPAHSSSPAYPASRNALCGASSLLSSSSPSSLFWLYCGVGYPRGTRIYEGTRGGCPSIISVYLSLRGRGDCI